MPKGESYSCEDTLMGSFTHNISVKEHPQGGGKPFVKVLQKRVLPKVGENKGRAPGFG